MAVDGTYDIEVDSPMGKMGARVTLETDGSKLKGTVESQMGTQPFENGTVDGDKIAWSMEVSSPMGTMELAYSGTVSGDEISGEVRAGSFGSSPFKGTRAS